jgi:hypothetical protein
MVYVTERVNPFAVLGKPKTEPQSLIAIQQNYGKMTKS